MSEQLISTPINNPDSVELNAALSGENTSMVAYGLLTFTRQAAKIKDKVAEKGAEISQYQDKIKHIHDILQLINKYSTEAGLDISQHPDIQEKLEVAKKLGVEFDEKKLKFSPEDRDFLKESLQLTESEFSNHNRMETQKMQMLIQEADRWLTLANTILKNHDRTTKAIIEKIR